MKERLTLVHIRRIRQRKSISQHRASIYTTLYLSKELTSHYYIINEVTTFRRLLFTSYSLQATTTFTPTLYNSHHHHCPLCNDSSTRALTSSYATPASIQTLLLISIDQSIPTMHTPSSIQAPASREVSSSLKKKEKKKQTDSKVVTSRPQIHSYVPSPSQPTRKKNNT